MLTLLRHARLASDEVVDLLVAAGRIAAIGALADRVGQRAPLGGLVRSVDLEGRRVLPGLVDAHVHVTGGGGERGFSTRVPRVDIDHFARAGVTSVIGVMGTDCVTRTMREVVAQTYALREAGLSAWCYTGGYQVPPPTLTGSVRDDVVYIDPIIGVGELALSDHRSSQPTLEELLRVASDAYVAGLTARKAGILHAHLGDGERGLDLIRRALEVSEIPARVWQPTHLNRNPTLWEEAKALALTGAKIWYDVTAFPEADLDGALSAADAVCQWRAAGLSFDRLTVSSDGGGCLPVFVDGEMVKMGVGSSETLLAMVRELVTRDVSLADAIALVATNPARAAMLPNKGVIAVGADADLLITDDTLQVHALMARGDWLVQDGALTARGRGVFA